MIEFSYTPTYRDFRRLARHVSSEIGMARPLLATIFVGLFIVSRLLPAGSARLGPLRDFLGMLGLISAALVAFVSIANYLGLYRQWRALDEQAERKYLISERGVQVRLNDMDYFLDWRSFVKAELKDEWFYLRTSRNTFHYFPRTAVPDAPGLIAMIARNVELTKGIEDAQQSN